MADRDKQAEKRQRNRVLKETRAAGDVAWARYEEARRAADNAYKDRMSPFWRAYADAKSACDVEMMFAAKAHRDAMQEAKADYVAMTGSPLRGKVRLP
jgi:hypothetical protein